MPLNSAGRLDWGVWDPITDRSVKPSGLVRMTLHTAATTSPDIYGPGKGPGETYAHAYNPTSAPLRQHQEAHHFAYADLDGNGKTFAMEHQDAGPSHGIPFSENQLDNAARVFADLVIHSRTCPQCNVPNRIATVDDTRGLAWHRLGVPGNWPAYDPNDMTTWCYRDTGELWTKATGKACVPTDSTEVLTSRGWVPILDVRPEDEVASWSPETRQVTYAPYLHRIEPRQAETVRVGQFETTPDHQWDVAVDGGAECDCGYIAQTTKAVSVHTGHATRRGETHTLTRKQAWGKVEAADLRRWMTLPQAAPRVEGLPLTLDEVRIAAWLFADAHYMTTQVGIDWHLRKQRKRDRITGILDSLDLAHSESTRADGTCTVRVYGEDAQRLIELLPSKRFDDPIWLGLSGEQVDALWEELAQADGASTTMETGKRVIFSTDSTSLGMIQAATLVNGHEATTWTSNGLHWLLRRKNRHRPSEAEPFRTTEVACLTTENGTLLIRQNGHVVITGNCPWPERIHQVPEIWNRSQVYINGGAGIDTLDEEDELMAATWFAHRRGDKNPQKIAPGAWRDVKVKEDDESNVLEIARGAVKVISGRISLAVKDLDDAGYVDARCYAMDDLAGDKDDKRTSTGEFERFHTPRNDLTVSMPLVWNLGEGKGAATRRLRLEVRTPSKNAKIARVRVEGWTVES